MNGRKILDILTLIACLTFVFLGFYIYFVKNAPLIMALGGILFFGAGAIVSIISLMSNQKGLFSLDIKTLSRKQNIIVALTALVAAISSLIVIIFFDLFIVFKIILLIGFLFFTIGSVMLLWRIRKT